jgi:pimeloyl-ACP methyl ester carboxylesterase
MRLVDTTTVSLADRLQRFAPACVVTPDGTVDYRQAGPRTLAVTHVLLHGIGSGSASWLTQLEAAELNGNARLLAWEAPGYGRSSPVTPLQPSAGDYAVRLWAWLDNLSILNPVTLVGHSLGALVATRAALQRPDQVNKLVLLAPAQGYARASAAERDEKLRFRLDNLRTLGPQGMAQKRGAAMLSPQADPTLVAYVQSVMAQVHSDGYTQACHLLSMGDLLTDLVKLNCLVVVASGLADAITPAAGCQQVAATAGVPWTTLGNAGHACALDAPEQVNTLLGLAGQTNSGPAA